jgi:hypothetical protein
LPKCCLVPEMYSFKKVKILAAACKSRCAHCIFDFRSLKETVD